MREVNDSTINLIKECEGVRTDVYSDPIGIPTVGCGHKVLSDDNLHVGDVIDDVRAIEFLHGDLASASQAVESLVQVELNDNQFGALCSFAFNIGEGNLKNSTLLKKLNAGDYAGAADEFQKWNKANGKVQPGLQKRRQMEQELFLRQDV